MMQEFIPVVAIVGRPNVGKSTLFNSFAGSRRAIVGDEPGITRDRLFHEAEWNGKRFLLVDTGGMVPGEEGIIPAGIVKQAALAMEQADRILFVTDSRAGIQPLDEEIYRLIVKTGKTCFIVVNKVDSLKTEADVLPFYRFGGERVFPVSAEHRLGLDDLLDELTRDFPPAEWEKKPEETRIAIIGRPNVGKSSLVNALVGSERVIVSEIPGTTRDAIDTGLQFEDRHYRLIDTAGIRKKGKTYLAAEKISVLQARKHLEGADLAILIIDPLEGVTHLDATIAGYALESGKALILGVNKLDLFKEKGLSKKDFDDQIRQKLRFLDYAPVVYFAARTGQGVRKLFPVIDKAREHRYMRITTGQLNQFMQKVLKRRGLDATGRERTGAKYMTQVRVAPPVFMLFAKQKTKLSETDRRFIINQLRAEYTFFANPVQLLVRK